MKTEDALEKLVNAVEKVAPKTWEIMVRQQVVEGVTYSIVCLFWAIPSALFLVWAARVIRAGIAADSFPPEGKNVVAIFGGIVALAAFVVAALNLPGFIMQASSPEYYAIQALLQVAK